MFDAFGNVPADWGQIIAVLALLSMFLGSIAGIGQRNIKRLMAYSSIAHMGFALVGLAAGTALILGAAYSLWMVKRVVFGPVANKKVAELTDLNGREFAILSVLAIATLAMGLYPAPIAETLQVSVTDLLQHVAVSKVPQ